MATPFLLRDSCPQQQIKQLSELNSPISVHFSSLIPRMLMFTLCHLLFDHFQFALIHGPNVPGSYAILLFTASDLASIANHIHNWVLFLLWLHPFILSGVISPLLSNSVGHLLTWGVPLSVSQPFHAVHGVLKAGILKWFATPFSSGPRFVRPLHHDPSIFGDPTGHGSQFHSVRQGCGPRDQIVQFSVTVVFILSTL